MQRLRNVFDAIPYQSMEWRENISKEDMEKCVGPSRPIFQIECNAYKLWRQLYVIGAYYSKLLSFLYPLNGAPCVHSKIERAPPNEIVNITISLYTTTDKLSEYYKQWQQWCTAMRFEIFKLIEFDLVALQNANLFKFVSIRNVVSEVMLKECSEEKIREMWRRRRDHPKQ